MSHIEEQHLFENEMIIIPKYFLVCLFIPFWLIPLGMSYLYLEMFPS